MSSRGFIGRHARFGYRAEQADAGWPPLPAERQTALMFPTGSEYEAFRQGELKDANRRKVKMQLAFGLGITVPSLLPPPTPFRQSTSRGGGRAPSRPRGRAANRRVQNASTKIHPPRLPPRQPAGGAPSHPPSANHTAACRSLFLFFLARFATNDHDTPEILLGGALACEKPVAGSHSAAASRLAASPDAPCHG